MAKQKKPVHKAEMTEGKRNSMLQTLDGYETETVEDILYSH